MIDYREKAIGIAFTNAAYLAKSDTLDHITCGEKKSASDFAGPSFKVS